jgi:urease accessory protein
VAAPQAVLKITHCQNHGSPYDLIRAAYHLGNRHVPIELKPDHLKIEPDHVLADMLSAMHLIVNAVDEPFEPENGAYATGGHHHGGHSHSDHDHDPHHAHATAPTPSRLASIPIAIAPAQAAPHVHGPGCGHQH